MRFALKLNDIMTIEQQIAFLAEAYNRFEQNNVTNEEIVQVGVNLIIMSCTRLPTHLKEEFADHVKQTVLSQLNYIHELRNRQN